MSMNRRATDAARRVEDTPEEVTWVSRILSNTGSRYQDLRPPGSCAWPSETGHGAGRLPCTAERRSGADPEVETGIMEAAHETGAAIHSSHDHPADRPFPPIPPRGCLPARAGAGQRRDVLCNRTRYCDPRIRLIAEPHAAAILLLLGVPPLELGKGFIV